MTKTLFGRLIILAFLLCVSGTSGPAFSSLSEDDLVSGRAKILSYLIRQQLPRYHFSHKPLDDTLSRAAFDLYIKQVDNQKRLLLQQDVNRLKAFETRIDDEILRSTFELPALTRELLSPRVAWVRRMVGELLDEGFDFTRHEFLLTDPDKMEFCRTQDELRDRWRKILKYQVITRYLSLEEDRAAEKSGENTGPVPSLQERVKEAVEKVRKSFDEYLVRLEQETVKDQYDRYFDAVARAYDPHTNYMPPTTKEDFDISLRGSLEGIGATLREEDGYVKVVRIIPGSAAARQGELEAEDVILKVAEGTAEPVDITDMPLRKAVGLIRGKKGTEVRLSIRKPDGTGRVVPIIRDVVEIAETFVKSAVLKDPDSGLSLGYIKIPSFYRDFESSGHKAGARNSTDDVRAVLDGFTKEKISGVVLDLRNNGGGALMDAVQITGLFIDQGPVVQIRDSSGGRWVKEDQDEGSSYGGPLVVLVNRFSASASEILAAALQDYRRAVVIGSSHTHGKGTVQTMVDLNQSNVFPNMDTYRPLGALKVTIQKFYRVTGESTQYRGVSPDISLPDVMEYMETGERYLDYSLPWDVVEGAPYRPWSSSQADLERLNAQSLSRVKTSPAFTRIQEQASKSRERREKNLQSLHIDTIRKEREDAKSDLASAKDAAHGHGEKAPVSDTAGISEEERDRLWKEGLGEDPYVTEALAVLRDLISPRATAHVGSGEPSSVLP